MYHGFTPVWAPPINSDSRLHISRPVFPRGSRHQGSRNNPLKVGAIDWKLLFLRAGQPYRHPGMQTADSRVVQKADRL